MHPNVYNEKQTTYEEQNGRQIYYIANIEHKDQSLMNDLNAKFKYESTLSI